MCIFTAQMQSPVDPFCLWGSGRLVIKLGIDNLVARTFRKLYQLLNIRLDMSVGWETPFVAPLLAPHLLGNICLPGYRSKNRSLRSPLESPSHVITMCNPWSTENGADRARSAQQRATSFFSLQEMISQCQGLKNPVKCQFFGQKYHTKWGVPQMGVPQYGWLIMEKSIKMHDWGVPPFQESTK